MIDTTDSTPPATAAEPVRGWWSRHALNTGAVFGLTVRGVRVFPRSVSYAIGHVGTWLAWRLMRETTEAVAANLRPLFPEESASALKRRALDTYRSYAADTIDFLRALSASPDETQRLFDLNQESAAIFARVLGQGRGALLVTGHFGNWEIGGILMGRVLKLPLTIVAMPEADPDVRRMRNETRAAMGVETLEVRQSLATALQIRETLGRNRVVGIACRSACRSRPRRGDVFWPPRLVLAYSCPARVSHGRAASSMLYRTTRTCVVHDRRPRTDLRRSHTPA